MDQTMEPNKPMSAFDSETFEQDTSFHLDQPVGSMSISPSGRDVVLASKEGLHIIDLDSPYSPPRYLQHRTSWEVADVQWSPFAVRDYWVVSTSNQKALVWNLAMSPASGSIEFILHGHTRAITDINFSAHNADVLATCAVDSFVHCWDLRTPQRPVNTFSDWFAGATQVKWSRQDPHVVASSHDKYLRIWDDRMGAYPVRSIEAHGTKIYGVDWNRFHPNKIATCSLDKTIKFWDCDNFEDVPERVINTPFPVWRARHTPFGWGLLAMPQRGNSDLHLYDRRPKTADVNDGKTSAVAEFSGHKGQVKEFLWRVRGPTPGGIDHRDFQLVSWGTDRELRLHRVDPETLHAVGYEKGVSKVHRLNFTRRGAPYKTFRDDLQEIKYAEVFDSRAASSPTPGQTFQLPPRGSTSMGMSKVPIPHSRGWVHGSTTDPRIGMHGKAGTRQATNPISWMKNVKISSWDQDTLAEEITQVGEKFTKVDFESIDVQQRKATISLQGPWGNDNAQIYMRLDMQFPKAYPRDGSVNFKVQKTTSMTDALLRTLSTELRTIAETYSRKRRGCLEAVLRYLLREQDMEQIVSWVLEETLVQSDILNDIDMSEDVSSDDDDDQSGAFQGPTGLLRSSDMLNTNVLVPVAKACGALWSDTSKLVCFFPPKPKESSMVMDSLAKVETASTRKSRLFEGFGRLHTRSPAPRTAAGTATTTDDAGSDTSDPSLLSTSSSSASSDVLGSLPTAFLPPQVWRGGEMGRQRSRSTDHSNKSVNGFGTKSVVSSPTNTISIHSFEDILPSRSDLAAEYQVVGSGSYICDHNAEVARTHGLQSIADIWMLIKMILRHDVPLECTSGPTADSDIVTVARSVFHSLRRRDSSVDLGHDAILEPRLIATRGRVRWGRSSFGSRHLIPAIFEHFEQLGDVQMLALLSCVLAEPKAADPTTALTFQEPHNRPLPLRCPAFSIDYYPSPEVAQHLLLQLPTERQASRYSKPAIISAAVSDQSSYPSTSADVIGDGAYPTGATPPFVSALTSHGRRSSRPFAMEARGLQDHNDISKSTMPSLSTSPEDSRLSHRSNSNLPFSFSRVSLSALAQSYSSSPPVSTVIGTASDATKRPSPSGSIETGRSTTSRGHGSSRAGRIEHSSSGIQADGSPKVHLFPSASTLSSRSNYGDGVRASDNGRVKAMSGGSSKIAAEPKLKARMRKVKIQSALHNQSKFDNDGYASVPLLDPDLESKFRTYRSSYAHLLGAWKLHVQRAEILKFDGLISYFASRKSVNAVFNKRSHDDLAWNSGIRRETIISISKAAMEQRGLEFRRRCRTCGNALEPVEKNGVPIGWHCVSASCFASGAKTSIRSLCGICGKSVSGLMVPCLECNHVTCLKCAEGWFGYGSQANQNSHHADETSEDEDHEYDLQTRKQTCPTGCGCLCLTVDFVSAPYPNSILSVSAQQGTQDFALKDNKARSDRLMSQHGPDTAIGAFLSLTRTRSISAAKESITRTPSITESSAIDDNDSVEGSDREGDPWVVSRYAGLGRGVGGGLSRGLRNKSSDVTIKKNATGQ